MKRYQIVLCIAAFATTAAAFWCAYRIVYEQLLGVARFLLFLALAALTI
mgnify:FL=1